MKDIRKEIENALLGEYDRWQQLYTQGGSDPFYSDGVNMDLVKNHILYYRRELEKLQYFPEVYNREIPPEVDKNYMARSTEILKNAKKTFTECQNDEDYTYLLKNGLNITQEDRKRICYSAVTGYVTGLRQAIERNDLITMRRYEYPDRYKESFRECRRQMEEILRSMDKSICYIIEESGQLAFT